MSAEEDYSPFSSPLTQAYREARARRPPMAAALSRWQSWMLATSLRRTTSRPPSRPNPSATPIKTRLSPPPLVRRRSGVFSPKPPPRWRRGSRGTGARARICCGSQSCPNRVPRRRCLHCSVPHWSRCRAPSHLRRRRGVAAARPRRTRPEEGRASPSPKHRGGRIGETERGEKAGERGRPRLRQTKDVAIAAPTPPSTSPLREGAGLKCQEDAAAQERRAAREDAEYADDCRLYHDNAPALRQVTAATTSSCLAVTPTSPMVSRSTKPPPFHPATCL
jgi:hypothetical protein